MKAKTVNENIDKEIIEKLAAQEHDGWSRWMKHLFSVSVKNKDGSVTIPKSKVDRWERQIKTDYEKLSDSEKESDRNEILQFTKIINDNES